MVENLAHKGWVFNVDDPSADVNCAHDFFDSCENCADDNWHFDTDEDASYHVKRRDVNYHPNVDKDIELRPEIDSREIWFAKDKREHNSREDAVEETLQLRHPNSKEKHFFEHRDFSDADDEWEDEVSVDDWAW